MKMKLALASNPLNSGEEPAAEARTRKLHRRTSKAVVADEADMSSLRSVLADVVVAAAASSCIVACAGVVDRMTTTMMRMSQEVVEAVLKELQDLPSVHLKMLFAYPSNEQMTRPHC
jgi:hypothetical protein